MNKSRMKKTGLLSLSEMDRMGDRLRSIICDSSPSPSPRTRRRGVTDSIACAIGVRRVFFFLLALFERERIRVRDYHDFQAPTKSIQARCRDLRALDGSRSGRLQFLVWPESPFAPDRAFRAGWNHDPTHPI